jgi:hypothetical protein
MTEKLEVRLTEEAKIVQFPTKRTVKAIDMIPDIIRNLKKYSTDDMSDFIQKFVVAFNEAYSEKEEEFLGEGESI